jgi:hypothetical protein
MVELRWLLAPPGTPNSLTVGREKVVLQYRILSEPVWVNCYTPMERPWSAWQDVPFDAASNGEKR